MKISIISPCFNSAGTIQETLESIKNQTYPDIEHLIIDGGSTDDTVKIISKYSHVAKTISESDHGIYDAMNKGIELATGDIIGILNSDDHYTKPNIIHKIVQAFNTLPIDSAFGDLNYINKQNKIIRQWRSSEYHKDLFLKGWMPPHPTFFLRKEYYKKYGLYNSDFSISADYELMLRMLYKYQLSCTYLPEVMVNMRTGGHSNNSWRKRWIANQEDRKAWAINGLNPNILTLWRKPFNKIVQYL